MSKKIILQKFLNSSSVNSKIIRYSIENDSLTFVKRYNIRGRKIKFNIKPVPDNADPINWIKGAVHDIVKEGTKNVYPSDMIGITFCGESFQERGPAFLNFKLASELKFSDIWDIISKVFQSNSEGKYNLVLNLRNFNMLTLSLYLQV